MKKDKLSPAHIVLFTVSLLAVLLTSTSYVRSALRERQLEAQSRSANGPGGRGGFGGGRGNFNPQQMAARRLEQMTTELQLTPDQRTKIEAIQNSMAPRTKAIFDDASLSREQRREKMRPLREESDAQIRQVLTPEQQTKFDAMQAQRRARFGNGGGMGGPGGGMGGGRRGNGGNGQWGQGNGNRGNGGSPSIGVAPAPPMP